MSSLDRALYLLLHDRACLDAFLAGRVESLGLSPGDRAALDTVDREQLVQTARRVREEVLRRAHRGSGALAELFPRTFAAWRERHPDDAAWEGLADAFLASRAFAEHRELPFAGVGTSLEEAFYRFAEGMELGDPAAREGEFLAAMVRALCLSPRADFALPSELRRAPGGWYAVATRGAPVLYAAVGGRLASGALTPFLAALLTSPEAPEAVAARHGVDADALRASLDALVDMGLR